MNLASLILARCSICSITHELCTLKFRFDFVTDNGSNSLGFADVARITKAFKNYFEKPLELNRKVTITTYTTKTFSCLKSFIALNKECRKLSKVDHRVAQESIFQKRKEVW